MFLCLFFLVHSLILYLKILDNLRRGCQHLNLKTCLDPKNQMTVLGFVFQDILILNSILLNSCKLLYLPRECLNAKECLKKTCQL